MKCLSLRQPWAWMVVHGGKTIENRRWSPSHRGPFLVHAAKGMTRKEYDQACEFAADVNPSLVVAHFDTVVRGGIIEKASIVNVIPPCVRVGKHQAYASLFTEDACVHPWHMPEQFGFMLESIEALPFRPLVGHLGFFNVDP